MSAPGLISLAFIFLVESAVMHSRNSKPSVKVLAFDRMEIHAN